ncbi:SGNH/GDSL hydrolase family protein [Streptomyces sp. NPDC004528]|uniref:SGNH/GDSL hydrolase family protein n=1 Tax=Streptomyces sp. NPDC004528 TaxID=3154550 RepID=UPI00339F2564
MIQYSRADAYVDETLNTFADGQGPTGDELLTVDLADALYQRQGKAIVLALTADQAAAIGVKLDSDAALRVTITPDGKLLLGDGTAVPDVTIRWGGAQTLSIEGAVHTTGVIGSDSGLDITGDADVSGDVSSASVHTGTVTATGDVASASVHTGTVTATGAVTSGGQPVLTQSSGDARYVQPAALPRMDLGYYVPAGWGQFWRPKRAAAQAGTGKAVVACVGSSSTQGLYSSNLVSTSFVGRLTTALQTAYGDGGSGFFSSGRSSQFLGAAASTTAWGAITGNLVTAVGTWNIGNPYGPGANYLYNATNGNSITFQVRGSTIRVYTLGGGGRVNWTYSIDSGTAVAVNDSGLSTGTIQVTTIAASAGTHTVKITHNGTNGNFLSVCGVTGENSTGVVVNNYGLSGAGSGTYADTTPEYGTALWNGGPEYPADLVIYALGANDALAGLAGDSWATNLRNYLQQVKDGTTLGGTKALGNTDVLILMQHIGAYDLATYKWQDYIARARGIAESYGAALVNMWPLGRNSWNYWNTLGYWGNSAVVGTAGTDTVHMSDAGHAATANALLPVITA